MPAGERSSEGDSTVALAGEVARLRRLYDELRGGLNTLGASVEGAEGLRRDVNDLEATVAELASMVKDLAQDEERASRRQGAVWWPTLTDPDERREAWETLAGWIDEVLTGRHVELYKQLRPCWFRHPDVVDELTALRVAWCGAYQDTYASATAPIEWLDRWLRPCIGRCANSMSGCKDGHEEPRRARASERSGDNFDQFVEADVSALKEG